VDAELAAVSRCAVRLASAEGHLRSQLGLNAARQEVRGRNNGGGGGARTVAGLAPRTPRGGGAAAAGAAAGAATDEVARQLHHQRLLLEGLLAKAGHAGRLAEAAAARLVEARARLAADVRDKAQALAIDEAVLGLHGGAGACDSAPPAGALPAASAPLAGDAAGPARRRWKWEGDAAALVSGAQQLVAETGRLRGKVKRVLADMAAAVVGASDAVNASMHSRIHDARRARAQLQERLREVRGRGGWQQRAFRGPGVEGAGDPLFQSRLRLHPPSIRGARWSRRRSRLRRSKRPSSARCKTRSERGTLGSAAAAAGCRGIGSGWAGGVAPHTQLTAPRAANVARPRLQGAAGAPTGMLRPAPPPPGARARRRRGGVGAGG
jgi:hypothetical protein